jgi:hypothetical protein
MVVSLLYEDVVSLLYDGCEWVCASMMDVCMCDGCVLV